MIGQWLADVADDDGVPPASIRIDIEDRGAGYVGHAYMFYPGTSLPGLLYPISLPKEPPHQTKVYAIYLHSDGGAMTQAEREATENELRKHFDNEPPSSLDVSFSLEGGKLRVDVRQGEDRTNTVYLARSDVSQKSELISEPNIKTWEDFRQWAVTQRPRKYIFRGQRKPHRLVSSFHRTWRKDVRTWINDDVAQLYGAVAERLNYPLQLGNVQHNAALWSILQHHGYPTPMIDWTYSPFVAAYFAFHDAEESDCAPRIFMFNQARWNQKYGKAQFIVDVAPNQLVVVESMAVANPRHTPQQALLTVTNVADVESFIRNREQADEVSYLTVCDLPMDSKPQIMRELELMGITFGSLFPGLDGTCRDMRDRLFAEPS